MYIVRFLKATYIFVLAPIMLDQWVTNVFRNPCRSFLSKLFLRSKARIFVLMLGRIFVKNISDEITPTNLVYFDVISSLLVINILCLMPKRDLYHKRPVVKKANEPNIFCFLRNRRIPGLIGHVKTLESKLWNVCV